MPSYSLGRFVTFLQEDQDERQGTPVFRRLPPQKVRLSCWFHLPPVDLVAARGVKETKARSAESDVGKKLPLRLENHAARAAGRVAHLNARVRGNVQSADVVNRHAVRSGRLATGRQPKRCVVALLVLQTAIGFDATRPQMRLLAVGDDQRAFARPEDDSIGTESLCDNAFLSVWTDVPHLPVGRVGEPPSDATAMSLQVAPSAIVCTVPSIDQATIFLSPLRQP